MSVTIHEVLGDLRSSALDERDKGDKFERLVQSFLRTDPEWTAKFEDVWTWSEWPLRANRHDTGIDLVAKVRDSDTYAAIQCKFYGEHITVAKGDIDSFLAASSKSEFSARYLFDTAAGWSKNADETLHGQLVPVQRVDISYLEDAGIDWSEYSWTTPEVLPSTGPKKLRPHQSRALEDVRRGLEIADRGKLIMACGTGKTFTSLRIAEDLVGEGGRVLFLVPSIQLLAQSLREWMANRETDIRPFAVCSDVRVGRKGSDEGDLSTVDLTEPATTDAATLAARMATGKYATPRMTVVFATYQSLDVVAQAQGLGVGAFDLVICDEAHRTTGVTLAGQDESHFVKVHDGDYLKAARRLYMTATPRVFGDAVRQKATDAEAVLADMGQEAIYGEELHHLGFGDAVEADLLSDYKVLVLSVDETYVAENFQHAMAESGEIKLDDAAKLIGCWNGLRKNFGPGDLEGDDPAPMRRAVAFARDIKSSQQATRSFPVMVERARQDETDERTGLRVEAAHVDGTMGIHDRNKHLAWLKDDAPEGVCRVLTNARCLSEGVDVPALDAVLFLTPRGSQVDVVQSVGRVMRKAPGKRLGYIILPIVVPAGLAPEDALRDNERYKVVWQVLQALRSHDERFHAMVNQIELNKSKPDRVRIIDVTPGRGRSDDQTDGSEQMALDYGFDGFRDAMYAKIVQKVGERKYWETWAKDVADIAQAHITRIKGLLADPESNPAKEFDEFLAGLRGNLNEAITRGEAIEMLAQHLITAPVFEALFEGYDFRAHNPVAQTMELMLASLEEHNLASEQASLDSFYASVRRRVAGVQDAEGKQRIIVELYDKFFATAFKRTVDRLGIVYTPIEIVDFILRSADEVLRAEFGQGLTDEGVHILDGFTGTGTFITRLLASGLIEPHDLARKYATELHANEMLLLAYYIAAVNIETTYAALVNGDGSAPGKYEPFPGLVLTDTFQAYEDGDRDDLDIFPENNERITRQRALPITVIVGNPPYSVGQDSANDDNANASYPTIDRAIEHTYVAKSSASSRKALYDSYIRAIKWASLRVADRGVIAFVTNGGFLEANTADGMRKSLAEEFSAIYVFNLRGNALAAGERGRREGRPVFEFGGWRSDGSEIKNTAGGSRATIAVTVLVKNPASAGGLQVGYAQVADYLTAGEKIRAVQAAGHVLNLDLRQVVPNAQGDWAEQRSADFEKFIPIGARGGSPRIFERYSLGVGTNRDPWVYNHSADVLRRSMRLATETYNESLSTGRINDARRIKWSSSLVARFERGEVIEPYVGANLRAQYRPFERTTLYGDQRWIHRPAVIRLAFPPGAQNLGLTITGVSSHAEFSTLATTFLPDLHLLDSSQLFPRWTWELVTAAEGTLDLGGSEGELVNGFRRIDNITNEALRVWQSAYGDTWTKDDVFFYVYGLLHSPDYRERYAADLKKMLPRIPLVATPEDARAFANAGRALSELHVGYESVPPYPLDGLDARPSESGEDAAYRFYGVGDKKMRFGGKGKVKDRSTIHYNDRIILSGIPEVAYRYQLGSRSAIEWIIDRYWVKTDKASGIVNDPNDWSREIGDPRYVLDLLARVVTVSVHTMAIVDALPPLVVSEHRG
ncbi:putative Helicase [metagenome]|uniref:Putative Helicase n=1 Tax=metagenome TaxID=256318 RepID=A0A2P2CJD9_9ZZZZ